jgi:hypothetical protein
MVYHFNREKAKKVIRQILDKMKTEIDPHLLNEYRSLFKKEVSLFRRSWAAAYLLMCYEGGGQGSAGRFDKGRSRKSGDSERMPDRPGRAAERRPRNRLDEGIRTPYPLADEDSRKLFINIGRNRRVFPREILGLINAKTATPKEDIGAIRILDNYSFVQVRDTVADAIIEALNGQSFRGRILTVSYARARREDGGGEDQEGFGLAAEARTEPEAAEYRDSGAADDEYGADKESLTDGGADDADYSGEDREDFDEGFEAPDETADLSEQDEDQPDKEKI